jgi:hypothetical protein
VSESLFATNRQSLPPKLLVNHRRTSRSARRKAKLHAGMNPNFFKGTVVEKEVDALLAASNVDARR